VGVIEPKRTKGEKRKRIIVYGNSEDEAWGKLNEIAFEIQTNQYVAPTKDTLIGFLKEYHRICSGYDMWNPKAVRPEKSKWEETTAELFKMYIDVHFDSYFKDIKLKDIKAITLDTFYNYKLSTEREHSVKQGKKIVMKKVPALSINTVIKLNKFLKAAFNYAVINDKLKKNPTDGVKLSSPVKYKPNVYDKDKFLKLLDAVHSKDEEIPVILGAGCGLRRGEICGLTWGNIDFKNMIITIEKTEVRFKKNLEKKPKNETSQRKIIAPSYVIDTLQEYYEGKDKPKANEKIITRWKPQSLSGMFSDLLKEYKLEHIRLHDLRHYNAVIMLRNGISDKVAAERLGHSNVSTLREVYQHVLKEMDKEAADMINNSIAPISAKQNPDPPLNKDERRKLFKVM
jgi:integrase